MFGRRKFSEPPRNGKGVASLKELRTLAEKLGSFEAAMEAAKIDVQDYIRLRAQAGEWRDVVDRLDEYKASQNARKRNRPYQG
ncbi:hypothetical protein [Hyphococcus luteus]|uniref:Uncharacterized protein n=1 Tax=Hyphococcus luteus TaxID=2058213 RepID=A0A2S7K7P7_9PROT|nr:hypothetical protein [Marinicaulis flavus]PQA88488.1 hypothetical protein CW354_09375 [Marinicaulis flavus]